MTNYPETLQAIVKESAAANQSDIEAAVESAFSKWSQEDEYEEWIEAMIRGQLRNMIHDVRHHTNTAIRNERGEYGQPAKVGLSAAVGRAAIASVLDTYSIDGRSLGDILGKELPAIAKSEREKGDGHHRNARLCSTLASIVPEEKAVRQAVSEKKARLLIQQSASAQKPKRAKAVA